MWVAAFGGRSTQLGPSPVFSSIGNELVLSSFFRRYTFPRSQVSGISRYQVFLSHGLRIEHTIHAYPRFIVFWSFDVPELEEALSRNAFPGATRTI
jgi:hypothetical protein